MPYKITVRFNGNDKDIYIPSSSEEVALGYCNVGTKDAPIFQFFIPKILDVFAPTTRRQKRDDGTQPFFSSLGNREGIGVTSTGNLTALTAKQVNLPSTHITSDARFSIFPTGSLQHFSELGATWGYGPIVGYDDLKLRQLPKPVQEAVRELIRQQRTRDGDMQFRDLDGPWKHTRDYPINVMDVALVQQSYAGNDASVRALVQPDDSDTYMLPERTMSDHASIHFFVNHSALFVKPAANPGEEPTIFAFWPPGLPTTDRNRRRFDEMLMSDKRLRQAFPDKKPAIKIIGGFEFTGTPTTAFPYVPELKNFTHSRPHALTVTGHIDDSAFYFTLPGDHYIDPDKHRVVITKTTVVVGIPKDAVHIDVVNRSNNPPVLLTLDELRQKKQSPNLALLVEQADASSTKGKPGRLPQITVTTYEPNKPRSLAQQFRGAVNAVLLSKPAQILLSPIAAVVDTATFPKRLRDAVWQSGAEVLHHMNETILMNSSSTQALEARHAPMVPLIEFPESWEKATNLPPTSTRPGGAPTHLRRNNNRRKHL